MTVGNVYAVCSGEAVKIGFCLDDPESRMRILQVGNPRTLVLAASVVGTRDDEHHLHHILSKQHIRGEWFRPDGVVVEAVRLMRKMEVASDVIKGLGYTPTNFPILPPPPGDRPMTQAERNHRWRRKNRARYNTYMREYRRHPG